MGKKDYKEQVDNIKEEMTLEEARAFRASLAPLNAPSFPEHKKREEFRKFWASNRNKYSRPKELEEILWIHLKAAKFDEPSMFEAGLKNFGLNKVK